MISDMPKLLRAVRLDDSDEQVFRSCGAAKDGEPVVTGGFATCDFANAPRCSRYCSPMARHPQALVTNRMISNRVVRLKADPHR